jgi:hypothetical protein
MKTYELDEVLACLPKGRTLFHYQKNQYIRMILAALIRHGQLQTIADLKQSHYSKWVKQPWVNAYLAKQTNAKSAIAPLLDTELTTEWDSHPFILSAGRWGSARDYGWCQTTRRGENMVLHLNLPLSAQVALRHIGVDVTDKLQYSFHPQDQRRLTLAWARLDIDFEHGQVLIEEVQSDLIRDMSTDIQRAMQLRGRERVWVMGHYVNPASFLTVIEPIYDALYQQWSDIMLTAALHFIFEELGIYDVYYHTWEGGKRLKRLHKEGAPPRSLYRQLPERFGFSKTKVSPLMLQDDAQVKRRIKAGQGDLGWYRLAV